MTDFKKHLNYPITVATCEDFNAGARLFPLAPELGGTPELFRVQDPFGLRKAIMPLFQADSAQIMTGMGTCFALDGWGSVATADHVVDFMRGMMSGASHPASHSGSPSDLHLLALLGMGLVFGTVGVPRHALISAARFWTPAVEIDDPLNFSGAPSKHPYDVSIIGLRAGPAPDMIRNLPIRSHPSSPRVGDLVVAVGFPEIELARGLPGSLPVCITEGMHAGYGRVTALYPKGRDRSTPTPVFEVEAHWPSGMSGGPVFNTQGEVIGLVSRSLEPAPGTQFGVAWATWLAAALRPEQWPASLDEADLYHRAAWAAVHTESMTIEGFPSSSREAAATLAEALGGGFVARWVKKRLGTDGFSISL